MPARFQQPRDAAPRSCGSALGRGGGRKRTSLNFHVLDLLLKSMLTSNRDPSSCPPAWWKCSGTSVAFAAFTEVLYQHPF